MGVVEQDEEAKLQKQVEGLRAKLTESVQKLGAEQETDSEAKRQKLNSGEAAHQGTGQEAAQNIIETAALVVEDTKAQLALAEALLEGCIQKQKLKAAMELAQQSTKKREASRSQAAGSSQQSGEPQP